MARIENDDHRSPGQEVDIFHPDREAYETEIDVADFKTKLKAVDGLLGKIEDPAVKDSLVTLLQAVDALGDRVEILQMREAGRMGESLRSMGKEIMNSQTIKPSKPRDDKIIG